MLRGAMLLAVTLALLAPASASAAKPAVTTGAAASITQTTVTLNAKVDANGKPTTYFFQIGTTKVYTLTTAETSAGAGANPVNVSVPVAGLAPATRYHYRIVARNEDGQTLGADRTFKTKVEPLGVTLVATPGSVAPGGSTVRSGALSGTVEAGRQVVLQSTAFPYTTPFANVGNPVITDAAGNFTFNGLPVAVTTQFRVLMPAKPEIVSPIVIVGAAVQLRTYTRKVERHRHSVSVRFSGYVSPRTDGARVNIQKLRGGVWTTIAHTRAKPKSSSRSRFKTRVRIYRSGQFRVLAESARPEYVAGAGRTVDIKVRR
jgi:hypothetical protein